MRCRCLVDGCDRLEELVRGRSAGGLCAGHRYRKRRGLPLESPLDANKAHRLTPWQQVLEASLAHAGADGPLAYRRAIDRLRKAVLRYGVVVVRRRGRGLRK